MTEKEKTLINNNDEWKMSYMTLAIKLADKKREGRREGNITALYDLYRDRKEYAWQEL